MDGKPASLLSGLSDDLVALVATRSAERAGKASGEFRPVLDDLSALAVDELRQRAQVRVLREILEERRDAAAFADAVLRAQDRVA